MNRAAPSPPGVVGDRLEERVDGFDIVFQQQADSETDHRWAKIVEFLLEVKPT